MTQNKHESGRASEIARAGTILRIQVGSGLHGTAVKEQDDRDEMGVCVEPVSCVIGLEKFEQYQYRTQPEGHRSGPGDTDLVVYSLRKWARLAAQGNPTVLMMLFAPESERVSGLGWREWPRSYADDLQARKDMFLSKQCGARFAGYLQSQKLRLLGLKSQRTNRPELIEQYGFDTKFAYHAIRLGWQGIELMQTGHITLPMPEKQREYLVGVRTGRFAKATVMGVIDQTSDILDHAIINTQLPDRPDIKAINHYLAHTYQKVWAIQSWT